MKTPKISIIVPVYNTEKHLRRCVDSILAQTVRDIEVLLVDDGSPDGCPQIVDDYAKTDSRVIALHKPNGGRSSARNFGLEHAHGTYIGFIDSDDYIVPEMYEKLLVGLEESGADFAACGILCEFESQGADVDQAYYDMKFSGTVSVDSRFFEKSDVSVCNKLFRRALIESGASPIRFPNGLNFEDSEFFWKYALRSKTIFCLQENLYCYVRHGGGIMKETLNGWNAHSIDAVKVCGNILDELLAANRLKELAFPFFFLLAGHYGLSAKSAHPDTDSETLKILRRAKFLKYRACIPESESWVRECLDEVWRGSRKPFWKKIIYTKTCKGVRRTFFCGVRIRKEKLPETESVMPFVPEETLPPGSPKVSVIVPVYNTERYLRQALNSICAQTLSELEIICVDDGSTDDSPAIMAEYAKKDGRVRVISKANAGYGHTVNVGLSHAKGEYVAIVEPDDYIAPDMYETLYSTAKSHRVPLAKCDWELFWEKDGVETKRERWRLVGTDSVSVFAPESNPIMCADASGIWAAIYNRAWLNQNGIRCLETPGASFQDTAFVMKTYLCAGMMAFVPTPFVSYRQTNPNSSINAGAGKAFMVFAEFDEILRFCKDHGILTAKNRALILKKMHATGKWNWERFSGDVRKRVQKVLKKYFRAMLADFENCPPEINSFEWEFILKIADIREPILSKIKRKLFSESYSKDSVRIKILGIRVLKSPQEMSLRKNTLWRKLLVRLVAMTIPNSQERKRFRERHMDLRPKNGIDIHVHLDMHRDSALKRLGVRVVSLFIFNKAARKAFRAKHLNLIPRDGVDVRTLSPEERRLRKQKKRERNLLRRLFDAIVPASRAKIAHTEKHLRLHAEQQANLSVAELSRRINLQMEEVKSHMVEALIAQYVASVCEREAQKYNAEIRELQELVAQMRNCLQEKAPSKPQAAKVSPYRIEGENNRVVIIENGRERLLGRDERIPGLEIFICGDDNEIRIHQPCSLFRSTIQIGVMKSQSRNNGVRVEIFENSTFHGVYLRCISGECQRFRFGRGSRIWGGEIILDEISGCIIGDDCNCSNNIYIWGSDGHAILDKSDPTKVLNEVKGPITVGDHTWIGQAVRLQKNARIPANTIVAAGAIVTKAFDEEFTVLAGTPAKVIKRGVVREPETLSPYLLRKKRNFNH